MPLPNESKRPKYTTPLSEWLADHRKSKSWLATQVRSSIQSIENLAFGRALPTLITAFQIERATKGGVPAVSWLGTELGRHYWNTGRVLAPRRKRNEMPA